MKDIFAAFGSEVFRPLVTLVLPGAIALSSWFAMSMQRWSAIEKAIQARPVEAYVVLLSLAVAFGLILEDLGSRMEAFFDRRLEKKKRNHMRVWYAYLCLAFKTEPVGESYVRAQVIRLKFELDTSVALLVAALGALFVDLHGPVAVWLPLGLFVLAAYLAWEAWATANLLSAVREELTKGITVIG